ncbi:DUF2306 domain-containing protein [Planomonospora sp. ID91781]|nr:DUF2306 domain-containing protein [Planomonospora sp. ID91781]
MPSSPKPPCPTRTASPCSSAQIARSRLGWTVVLLTALAITGYSLALYAQGSLRTLAADDAGLAGAYGGAPAGHQAWMIRNYALTYAAVTLRTWLGVLIMVQTPFAGMDADFDAVFANAYHAVPFLCRLPNIVVAEWLIRRRGLPSYRLQGDGRSAVSPAAAGSGPAVPAPSVR